MKKFALLVATVLFAFNANAIDLVKSLNKVSATTNETAQKIEAQKAADQKAKADLEAAVAAKKSELEAKAQEQKAADEAKAQEQAKALQDAKDSVNNLKNALTK